MVILRRLLLFTALAVIALLAFYRVFTTGKVIAQHTPEARSPDAMRVLFIAGRDSHGEGEHEHKAGVLLLDAALRQRYPDTNTTVIYGGWPGDEAVLEGIDALVMYCDGGPFHPINRNVEAFNALVAARVGVVALHYCVEVPKGTDAAIAMLAAIGGYFETDWSVNPHWTAHYSELPDHPVTLRAQPFSLLDEWYFNMRFVPSPQKVQPILRAIPPASTMDREDGPHSGNPHVRTLVDAQIPQVTAWGYERLDGSRGFGFTGGHFHANWDNDNVRNIVIDAIAWTAAGRTKPAQ